MMSGEVIAFIENVNFSSKEELLKKLKTMRLNTTFLVPRDRQVIRQMLGVAFQQVFHTPEEELLSAREGRTRSKDERN